MLTLKVVTVDHLANRTTHVFTGKSISHREFEEVNRNVNYNNIGGYSMLGSLDVDKVCSDKESFIISDVVLENTDSVKHIIVLPYAEGYIMEDGKTVDNFECYFINN